MATTRAQMVAEFVDGERIEIERLGERHSWEPLTYGNIGLLQDPNVSLRKAKPMILRGRRYVWTDVNGRFRLGITTDSIGPSHDVNRWLDDEPVPYSIPL